MIKLFGGKPDHPLADAKEARAILEAASSEQPLKALEELGHWLDSLSQTEGFRPEDRAQRFVQLDDVAQAHLRKLSREYLASARLSKFQEQRLWSSIHGYWSHCAAAFAACAELYSGGGKSAEVLKGSIALLSVRALRALGQQMKWQYMRYGPFDHGLWGEVAKVYAQAEERGFARQKLTAYAGVPGDTSPEQEFLRAVMLSASSPDGLMPVEIELAERLIAHFSASFTLVLEQQPDIAYWIDLATSHPPLRLARPPQHAPTLRFFAAGKALQELEELTRKVQAGHAVPSSVNLGGAYEPDTVLAVLQHLALYWSTKPPERKSVRHRVKTRLSVVHGFEGVLNVIAENASLDSGATTAESWIVDNVSAGGFGAVVPQVPAEWLKIGCLLGLQPEGGTNWVLGMVRRFNRETAQQASVGIQTLARALWPVQFRTGAATEAGLLLDPQGIESATEARVMLKPGVFLPGQNLEFGHQGKQVMLLPQQAIESTDDYELLRCRVMVRDAG